eukprot:64129-Prymnesium_polylepis.1
MQALSNNDCRLCCWPRSLAAGMMCARAASRDSCNGDSGGPLWVAQVDGAPLQVGIVSFGGSPCASWSAPGVYTR